MKPCARCKQKPRKSMTRPYCIDCERLYNRERYQKLQRWFNALEGKPPKAEETKADQLFQDLMKRAKEENRHINKRIRG